MTGLDRRNILLGALAATGTAALASRSLAQVALEPDFLGAGTVGQVYSGDSFTLNDGRRVRLAGIEAPRAAQAKAVAQPLAHLARSQLEQMVLDQRISFANPAPDRFGRLRAHAYLAGKTNWIQGELLRLGLARVRTWSDDYAKSTQMLELENEAREAKTGIWARMFYAIRQPETVSSSEGSFQLVQGEIVDASSSKKLIYLNFGTDWRKDFTVQIDKKTAKLFAETGTELMGLSGARVRVRGTVRYRNGPVIWLNHPSQLEILPGS